MSLYHGVEVSETSGDQYIGLLSKILSYDRTSKVSVSFRSKLIKDSCFSERD